MKKNKMMRLASLLLVAVLLTTSIISGTFAKYVTRGETSDSARVAQFGVTIAAEGQLFSKNYYRVTSPSSNQGTDAEEYGDPHRNYTTLTVESNNGDDLVAPGTKNNGNGLNLGITGTPEVDVVITFEINADYQDIFLKAGKYPDLTTGAYTTSVGRLASDATFNQAYGTYYPIRYTLAGTLVERNMDDIKTALDGQNNVSYTDNSVTGTLANIKAVLDVINTYTTPSDISDGKRGIYVDANTDLSTIGLGEDSLQLTWEWPFEASAFRVVGNNGSASVMTTKTIDKMDTLLGDLAATNGYVRGADSNTSIPTDNYSLNVSVPITVTVTQVD